MGAVYMAEKIEATQSASDVLLAVDASWGIWDVGHDAALVATAACRLCWLDTCNQDNEHIELICMLAWLPGTPGRLELAQPFLVLPPPCTQQMVTPTEKCC
jgi:hypothetical protein